MSDVPKPTTRGKHRTRWVLIGSLAVTAVLYAVPLGRYLVYPCLLLSTLAHEMGHGVTALLVGGHFQRLQIWPDGSGVAQWSGQVGGLGRAVVAAGGLIGPAVLAAIAFVVARRASGARICLASLALILLVAEGFVVRGFFAMVFVGLVALACILATRTESQDLPQWVLIFLAVQLALSVFSRGDYLFTPVALTSAGPMPSDVAQIEAALALPYWFWGGVCGGISVVALGLGLRVCWRAD